MVPSRLRSITTSIAMAGVVGSALLLASCGGGGDNGDSGGNAGAKETAVRACLKKSEKPLSKQGLLFLVIAKSVTAGGGGEPIIGVEMTDIAAKDPSARAQIVISDSDEFIDRWEEEMNKDPDNDLVTRTGDTVVNYQTQPTGLYAKGKAAIDSCVQSAGAT